MTKFPSGFHRRAAHAILPQPKNAPRLSGRISLAQGILVLRRRRKLLDAAMAAAMAAASGDSGGGGGGGEIAAVVSGGASPEQDIKLFRRGSQGLGHVCLLRRRDEPKHNAHSLSKTGCSGGFAWG